MTTPAELRALAKRVCEEAPGGERSLSLVLLESDIYEAVSNSQLGEWWRGIAPSYMTSLHPAASLMPGGWNYGITYWAGVWRVSGVPAGLAEPIVTAKAPTEPQARAAAALLAMAADMESKQ